MPTTKAPEGADQASDPEVMQEISDQTDEEMAEIEEIQDTDYHVAKGADSTGNALLSAFIDELTAAGVRRNEDIEFILERLTRRIKSELRHGYLKIMARDVPTVTATMGKVVLGGDKIQGTIVIDKHIDAKNRHALSDFAGNDVLIVMASDIEEHLADMDGLAKEAGSIQTEFDLAMGAPVTPESMAIIDEVIATQDDDIPAELIHTDDDSAERVDVWDSAIEEMSRNEQDDLAYKLALDLEAAPIDLEDIEGWSDEQVANYIGYARGKLAERDALSADVEKIDESRIQRKDGVIVGIAPDPDCEICSGNGGWDDSVDVDSDETVDEWVRCECVELPNG